MVQIPDDQPVILKVGVKVLLKNRDGKYLLIRRSLVKYPDIAGRWDIPGGRIKPGTTLLENLEREINEETNLRLASKPVLLYAQDILRKQGEHTVRLIYSAEARGRLKICQDEHDKSNWLTLTEIKKHTDVDIYLLDFLRNNQNVL